MGKTLFAQEPASSVFLSLSGTHIRAMFPKFRFPAWYEVFP